MRPPKEVRGGDGMWGKSISKTEKEQKSRGCELGRRRGPRDENDGARPRTHPILRAAGRAPGWGQSGANHSFWGASVV